MRAFTNPRLLPASLGGTVLLTGLCLPYLYRVHDHQHPELARAGVVVMFMVVTLIMWQARLAWTPPAIQAAPHWRTWQPKAVAVIVLLLAVLAAFSMLVVNPRLMAMQAYVPPQTRLEALLTLPWYALFFPLACIAFPYAVVLRVTRRPVVAWAAVVLFIMLGIWMQQQALPPLWRLGVVAVRLPHVCLAVALYPRLGFWGTAALAAGAWCRYLLWPGM